MSDVARQKPVEDFVPTKLEHGLFIVSHPAFRIGFLDAQAGRRLDHDNIMQRIVAETKDAVLKAIGWRTELMCDANAFRIAQYRYEKGQILQYQYKFTCRGWSHPDYPPKCVMEYLYKRFVFGEAV